MVQTSVAMPSSLLTKYSTISPAAASSAATKKSIVSLYNTLRRVKPPMIPSGKDLEGGPAPFSTAKIAPEEHWSDVDAELPFLKSLQEKGRDIALNTVRRTLRKYISPPYSSNKNSANTASDGDINEKKNAVSGNSSDNKKNKAKRNSSRSLIPYPWEICRDQNGEAYYLNRETNETTRVHPLFKPQEEDSLSTIDDSHQQQQQQQTPQEQRKRVNFGDTKSLEVSSISRRKEEKSDNTNNESNSHTKKKRHTGKKSSVRNELKTAEVAKNSHEKSKRSSTLSSTMAFWVTLSLTVFGGNDQNLFAIITRYPILSTTTN